MKVLIVEDSQEVSNYIANALQESGYITQQAFNGEEGLFFAQSQRFDVLVVDRMLPILDGLSMVKRIREQGNLVPVLMLSALGEVDDKVKGFSHGADDYLAKPFAYVELHARLNALVRRNKPSYELGHKMSLADLTLDLRNHKVTRANQVVKLQSREFKLLEYLLRHKGQLVTRTMLLENVWEYNFDPQTNVVDVHISRLRSKVDKGFERTLISTVRGAGYIIND
ncbi:response regulator transcription factor [Thalassotalea ganghwensis]